MEFNAYELLSKMRGGNPFPENDTTPKTKAKQSGTNILKRERVDVRVELEKDINRLNEEISKLKAEKRLLKTENAQLKASLDEQKEKDFETIANLRQEIVMLRKRINSGQSGTYGMYADGSPTRLTVPSRNSAFPLSSPALNRQDQYLPPPPADLYNELGEFAEENRHTNANTFTPFQEQQVQVKQSRRSSNFAGPTFSELMRRSAPVYKSFQGSLRDAKAFNVATSTVMTNANQNPEFVQMQNIRRSIFQIAQQQLNAYNEAAEGEKVTATPQVSTSVIPPTAPSNSRFFNMVSDQDGRVSGNASDRDIDGLVEDGPYQHRPFSGNYQ